MGDVAEGEDAPVPVPMKCELQTWHTRIDKDGVEVKTLVDESNQHDSGDLTHALSLNRVFDEKGSLESSTLTVNSKHILKTLADVVSKHPSIARDFNLPIDIKSPYQALAHNWDELHAYAEAIEDDTARMHTNLLLGFMDTEFGKAKSKHDTQIKSGYVNFTTLWMMYKPGTVIVLKMKNYPWMMRVVKTQYEQSMQRGKELILHCVYTDHDGESAGESTYSAVLSQKASFGQDEPCKISELLAYPIEYLEHSETIQEELYQRGQRFLSLSVGNTVCDYDGLAQFLAEPPPTYWSYDQGEDPGVWSAYTESGKVVVDRKTYGEEHVAPPVTHKRTLVREDIILCPPFLFGYSCSRKDWCRFFLPKLLDAKWRPDPFKDLVLPDAQKSLVQALVSSHEYPEHTRDQTQQKGKGLVVLLHGPPGSGKTLTAECSSQLTRKALFSCSMSELNRHNSAYWFEERLAKVLRLATAWEAIILLDEADVFLEARLDDSSGNSERNALVAIFLKHLEYFSGIIFLTTNRVGVFDLAMKSRIHLALGFSSPDRASRRRIWQKQLVKLPQGVLQDEIDGLLDLVQDHILNGREISYSVLTATTLARYNKEPLQMKHIKTVLDVRQEFEDSLHEKKAKTTSQEKYSVQTGLPIRQNSVLTQEPESI